MVRFVKDEVLLKAEEDANSILARIKLINSKLEEKSCSVLFGEGKTAEYITVSDKYIEKIMDVLRQERKDAVKELRALCKAHKLSIPEEDEEALR